MMLWFTGHSQRMMHPVFCWRWWLTRWPQNIFLLYVISANTLGLPVYDCGFVFTLTSMCVFVRVCVLSVREQMLSAVEGILSARSDSLQCCVGSSPSLAEASQVNKGMMWRITTEAQMVCVYTHTHTHTHTQRFVRTCFINMHCILQGFRDHQLLTGYYLQPFTGIIRDSEIQ